MMRDVDLGVHLEALGRAIGERERAHTEGLSRARVRAQALHAEVESALQRFHSALEAAGASQLRVEQGRVRIDEKHLRSVEFDLCRGRHRAVVVVKSRGEVTLVGPFRVGKAEGPCRSFPMDDDEELAPALASFLGDFVEAAATP